MTKERDSAVSQLGIAYFTIEQLKSDNNTLAIENRELKKQINRLTASHEDETQEWTTKEDDLRRQIQQTKESVRNLEEMSKDMFNGRKRSTDVGNGNPNATDASGLEKSETQPYVRLSERTQLGDRAIGRNNKKAKTFISQKPDAVSGSRTVQKTKNLLRGIGPTNNDETFHSQDSDEFLDLAREEGELSQRSILQVNPPSSRSAKDVRGNDSSQDLTYLSFLQVCLSSLH